MQRAKYVRLFADEQGESHFEDFSVDLLPVDFAPPAGPLNIAAFTNASRSLWVGASVGWAGDVPHPAPQRQVFCILIGNWETTASDGEVRLFKPGDVVLLEDTWGKGHSTRLTTDHDGLILAVVLADD